MEATENLETASLMLDHAPVAAYWTREDGSFAWVNQGACDMLGYTRDELLALDIFAVDAGATPGFWSDYWQTFSTRKSGVLERQHRRRDGSVLPVEVTIRLLEHRGTPVHFAFVRDLTSQKQAEQLQKNQAQYMTALFRDSPLPQLIIDPENMQIVDANNAARRFYGYETLEGVLISSINTLSPEEIQTEMNAARTRKRHFFRFQHRLASGSIREVHVHSAPIEHNGRSLLHSSIEDMTPLYAIQYDLEGYRDQLERLPIGIYKTTPGGSGIIVNANEAMCDILDIDSKTQLLGRRASDFHPDPEARGKLSDLLLKAGTLRKIERELVTAKGRRIYAAISVRKVETPDGQMFFEGAVQDITPRKKAERDRERALARLNKALQAAPIPIMLHRVDGEVELVNTAWCTITGYQKDELKTIDEWTRLAYGKRAESVRKHIRRLENAPAHGVDEGDFVIRCKDGSLRTWAFYSNALESPDQPDSLLISTAIDVSVEREKQRQSQQAEAIVQSAAEGITITGPDRNIQRVNPAFTRITGYSMDEVVGKNPRILSSGRQDTAFYERMWRRIDDTGHWQDEIWNRRKNGEIYPEWLSISAIHDARGELINYAAVFTDLSELKHFEATLQHLQRFDPLTGLPNRETLLEAIGDAIQSAAGNGAELALLVCGLDRFHRVNETFGHETGDRLLEQLAARIQSIAGDDADVARLGGDHFALLAPDTPDDTALSNLILRLRGVMARPFPSDEGKPITVSFSTGVARYPADARSPIDLLRSAETAMFQAKRENPGLHAFFDGTTTEAAQKRLLLEIDLRRAIDNNALEVYFQPVVRVADNTIVGAEGLARWTHPELGAVSPEVFIAIAEESGLIGPLTELLLAKAARSLADLSRSSGIPLQLAFNISATQLNQHQFVDKTLHALQAAGLAPDAFELELTESTLMQRVREAPSILARLRAHGISISIDDFGTGFSSLAYLQEIKAQTLKIDRRFVTDCADNEASAQLVRSIIAMGHALDMQLIAEGVETPEQLALLRSLDCEYYQGYLFSRPLSIADFTAMVADNHGASAHSPE